MEMIPLLLTAAVNPRGMEGAAFSIEERVLQYVDALTYYLKALPDVSIVFAENSDSLSAVRRHFSDEKRIEWLDANIPCDGKAYDQSRGKGYNEVLLLEHAVRHSVLIRQSGCFFKLTGRLKVLNLSRLLAECQGQTFRADCKDHRVYEWLRMPINGHSGECRYWYATTEFFLAQIAPYYDQLCDFGPKTYLAEDLMLQVCRRARTMPQCHDRFKTQARISGHGGHKLGSGPSFFYSTNNDSLPLRIKCALRQMLRWTMPWWRC